MPQLRDMVTDEKAKALIALIQSQGDIQRFTAGPPDIPKDRLDALRAAYKKAMEDPELQAKAAKLERPVEPAYGDDVLAMIKVALNQTPETIALLKEALEAGDKAAVPRRKARLRNGTAAPKSRSSWTTARFPGRDFRLAHRHHHRRQEKRAREHQDRNDLHDRRAERRRGQKHQLQLRGVK